MFSWLWTLIVGGIIGAIAGAITNRNLPAGIIGNIIAGLVGASLGQWLLGDWGPSIAGMAIIPALLGAIILVLLVSVVLGMTKKRT